MRHTDFVSWIMRCSILFVSEMCESPLIWVCAGCADATAEKQTNASTPADGVDFHQRIGM